MEGDLLDDEPMALALDRDSDAPAVARHFAAAATRGVVDSARRADLELLVSELVSNAVLHGTGAVSLVLRRDGNCVRAEVSDGSAALPTRLPSTGAHGGFGVRLLSRLAESWGVDPHPDGGGKTVWFRV